MKMSCESQLSTEKGVHAYLVQSAKCRFAFSTDENSETLESSALGDGWSMLAMFLTVLYEVEGLETETLKYDLVQKRSDSS